MLNKIISVFIGAVLASTIGSSPAQASQAPAITSASSASFTTGTAGSFTVTATGSPTPAISETGALPTGVTFVDNGNGTATLAGTPAAGTGGTYSLTLGANNGVGTAASQPFTLTVSTAVNTIPEGIFTYTLPSTTSGSITSYFGLQLTMDPVYTGAVSTITTVSATAPNTISVADSPAPWTAGQFATASAPYFVKFLTGAEAGRVLLVKSNTTNSVTLDITDHSAQTTGLTTTNFSVTATAGSTLGDSFEIFPGDTLSSVFGSTTAEVNANGLAVGNVISADEVGIYSVSLTRFQSYYFDSTAGFWKLLGSSANANNTVLYPYSTFAITRNSGEPQATFTLSGRVPEVNRLVKTTGGSVAIFDSTGYPVDMKLSDLKLYSSTAFGPNWVEGNVVSGDEISVWNASLTRFDAYYELTDNTWRKVGGSASTDVSSFLIPAGTTVSFLKNTSVTGSSSYLQPIMPYSN